MTKSTWEKAEEIRAENMQAWEKKISFVLTVSSERWEDWSSRFASYSEYFILTKITKKSLIFKKSDGNGNVALSEPGRIYKINEYGYGIRGTENIDPYDLTPASTLF